MGNKENKMFCFQCQETAGCSGCTVSGVCGKKPDVAAMQDLLVYVTKGLSAVTTGRIDPESGKSRSTSGSSTLERNGSGF